MTSRKRKAIPFKWELIIFLWVAFFLNKGDQQVFNVVIPLIKPDLGLNDIQIGLVATIFTIIYGILVPVAGYAGDKFRKTRIILLSLLIFSTGTLITGMSTGLIMLILFRALATGGAESFYYPAASTLIGEHHTNTRAQALSIHQTANYVGIIASGFIAGYIGEHFGWRHSFILFGAAGILWAVLLYYRIDKRHRKDLDAKKVVKESAVKIPLKEVIAYIRKKPTILMLSLAFGGFQFVMIGYLTWMPTFLHEKFNLSLSNAGFSSVFYHHVFAFLGVLAGGKLSDKISLKRKKFRMETEFLGLLLGAPFVYLLGAGGSLVIIYIALGIFGFFRGIYDSNIFAALFDFVDLKYRSSASGFMLSIAYFYSALSPVLLGWVKDTLSLDAGFTILSAVYLLSAIFVMLSIKLFFKRDYIGNN